MRKSPETGHDAIRRIAFVTRRFHELRGLIPASFGAGLILATFAEQAAGTAGRWQHWTLHPLIFANIMMTFAFIALDRGYRQTFGHPVATARQRATAGLFSGRRPLDGGAGGAFAVVVGGMIDVFLPRPVSLMATALTAYALWILVRDWPWRIHYLAAVAAGMMGAVVAAGDPSGQGPLRAYLLIGLAMLVTGLCDHRLLGASMAGNAASENPFAATRNHRYLERTAMAIPLAASGTMLIVWDPVTAAALARLALMALVISFQVIVAVPTALRAIREFSKDGRVTEPIGPNLNLQGSHLVLVLAAAIAGAIESAFDTRGLFAFTLAVIFVCTALRTRPLRFDHLAIAAFVAVAGLLGRDAEPFRAFGMLLIAASLALMLPAVARHSHETSDANTV